MAKRKGQTTIKLVRIRILCPSGALPCLPVVSVSKHYKITTGRFRLVQSGG